MKNIYFSAAMLVLVAFSSCKKDYTCECTTSDGQGGSAKTSVTITESKKDAEDACKAGNSSVSSGGMTVTSSCEIK